MIFYYAFISLLPHLIRVIYGSQFGISQQLIIVFCSHTDGNYYYKLPI